MFIDFLSRAEAVFDRDARDLSELCDELNTESAFVGFMPAVTFDLWPIYSLGCTRISRFTSKALRTSASEYPSFFMPR